MKFLYFDSNAANYVINDRTSQSVEFDQGKKFISFIREGASPYVFSDQVVAYPCNDGGYIISFNTNNSNHSANYVVFDLDSSSSLLRLNDDHLLLAIQKTLRFCIKSWEGLSLNSHEYIHANNRASVFPFPIREQTGFRIFIDRNPDEKRRERRENSQACLIYQFENNGNRISETPSVTNFRKAKDKLPIAYSEAKSYLIDLSATNQVREKRINVTELDDVNNPSPHIYGNDNWQKLLTASQLRFIDNDLSVPHRIEGPAGTGKTLCLALKAITTLDNARKNEKPHRSIFLAHSQATKKAIESLLLLNEKEHYTTKIGMRGTQPYSVEITTLHELCAHLLKESISESELIDKDAYESKQIQKLYAIEAIEFAEREKLDSYKPLMSKEFLSFFESTDKWAIAEMLQHEISVQIKGRSDQDLNKYKKLPRLQVGLPTINDGDKSFVFVMYNEYQKQLEISAQFDTDDVVLTAISQLATPIWRRRRLKEGFDSIFIDETHLFNINELSIFHKLTCDEAKQPIAYSVDRSQALGDRGWSSSESFDSAFDPTQTLLSPQLTNVKRIFRCSPEIIDLAFSVTSSGATLFTNFHNPLTDAVSAFSANEEKKCKKPYYIEFASDDELINGVFDRADLMLRELNVSSDSKITKADIALIAFDDGIFVSLQELAKRRKKPIELIKSRGDLETVIKARQDGRFILSAPEFVGGLEFAGVILIGVDKGRFPPLSSGSNASQEFLNYSSHQKLYVAITRAKYRVEVLVNSVRGLSETLKTAKENELIVLDN